MCQVNAHYCKKIVEVITTSCFSIIILQDLYNGKFPKLKFFNCDFYMLHNIHNIRKRIVSTVGEFERSYAASHECEMDQFTCLDSRRFVFELQLETAREDEWSLTLTDSNGGDPYDQLFLLLNLFIYLFYYYVCAKLHLKYDLEKE